jgi:prolyl oligopeptidase
MSTDATLRFGCRTAAGFLQSPGGRREAGAQDYYLIPWNGFTKCRHRPEADIRVLSATYPGVALEPTDFPAVRADPTSRSVVAIAVGGVRRENPLYIASLDSVLANQPQWRKVCDVADEVTGFAFRGDELFLQTTRDAPNAKVLRTTLSAPDPVCARPPEGQKIIACRSRVPAMVYGRHYG